VKGSASWSWISAPDLHNLAVTRLFIESGSTPIHFIRQKAGNSVRMSCRSPSPPGRFAIESRGTTPKIGPRLRDSAYCPRILRTVAGLPVSCQWRGSTRDRVRTLQERALAIDCGWRWPNAHLAITVNRDPPKLILMWALTPKSTAVEWVPVIAISGLSGWSLHDLSRPWFHRPSCELDFFANSHWFQAQLVRNMSDL
jgi:hypothetical protein